MGCGSSGLRPFAEAFELQEVVGKGRFGEVYAAVERASREPYAVRLMPTSARADLLQEAKIWKSVLDSKYIVQWYTIRADGITLFFLMERCQCNFVQKLKSSSSWNVQKTRAAFKQMLRAVEWIHSCGVAHRDIKASNFLCGGDKGNTIMKLTDFSMACQIPQGTRLFQEVGSWQYRSPEMHSKAGYSEKTDIWSFGVMAYALLFNEFPYGARVRDKERIRALILGNSEPECLNVPAGHKVGEFLGPAARFCRVLLRRNQDIRCTAAEALQLGFITGMACSVEMESDCTLVRKQDHYPAGNGKPVSGWDRESAVESQFSEFTVDLTRNKLAPLPLIGSDIEDLS